MTKPVLVVDNSPAMRRALVDWLVLKGYRAQTAINGTDALDRLHAGLRPCLILFHLQMPASDGFEFRRRQLDDPRFARIPVVVYSGLYDPRLAAGQLNASAYVFTPFDTDALGKVIETFC